MPGWTRVSLADVLAACQAQAPRTPHQEDTPMPTQNVGSLPRPVTLQAAFIGVTNPQSPRVETAAEVSADLLLASRHIARIGWGPRTIAASCRSAVT